MYPIGASFSNPSSDMNHAPVVLMRCNFFS